MPNKAGWGSAERKIKDFFFIFGAHLGSWWIELKRHEGAFTSPLSCLPPTSLCLMTVPGTTSPLLQRFLRKKPVWQQWVKCQERTQSRGKTNQQTERKKKKKTTTQKLSKIHSGTNVTAQSRAAEAPDEGPETLHLWRRSQMTHRCVFLPFTNHCPLLEQQLSSSRQELTRCHMRLLWSNDFSDAFRASHICSFRQTQTWHTWSDGKSSWLAVWLGASPPSACNGNVRRFFFFLLLKHDVLLFFFFCCCFSLSIAHFLVGTFQNLEQKEEIKKK